VQGSLDAGFVNISLSDGSAKGLSDSIGLRIYSSRLAPKVVRRGELPIPSFGY